VDRNYGYPVPYRCFYSKNIENLFIAGRCASVTHEALGTVRVMKTCGMMGEVVGKAASICRQHNCDPRAVYQRYWDEMDQLLKLPGGARRLTVNSNIVMPDVIPEIPSSVTKLKLPGFSKDDSMAATTGDWNVGSGLKGYAGVGYQYAGRGSKATMTFKFNIAKSDTYDIRVGWRHHKNRATNATVIVKTPTGNEVFTLNMQQSPSIDETFQSLGKFKLESDTKCLVVFDATGADGVVCTDFVQLLPVK
jgi:hypothetical protein